MARKRILVTGASGMLGATLVDSWQSLFDVYATDKKNFPDSPAKHFMDFNLLYGSYDNLVDWAEPEIIVHCAAITDVDYCEDHPHKAMTVNGHSVRKFLETKANARLIFISSEAVFPDGLHLAEEKDNTDPQNVYGMSKELGERLINNAGKPHAAIRTTIIGKNINQSKKGFVERILKHLKDGEEITLFNNENFTPITIWHLADELKWVINNNISGIIHIAGKEPVSKYELGFSICEKLGLDTTLIKEGNINNVEFKAKRSKDKTMDSRYYQSYSKRNLPNTDETVELIIQQFQESGYK